MTSGVVLLTGIPAAGKTTIGTLLVARLEARGVRAVLLDGDAVRGNLYPDLGFTPEDRRENLRRVTWLAETLAERGVWVVVAVIAPYAADRGAMEAALKLRGIPFFEVYAQCTEEEARRRDPKGLYKRGHDLGPYEVPLQPLLTLDTQSIPPEVCVEQILELWKPLPDAVTPERLFTCVFQGMEGGATEYGSSMAAHMCTLALLGRFFRFGHVVELGVGPGWSTVALLLGVGDGVLTSYDLHAGVVENVHRNLGGRAPDRWIFRAKDSVMAAEEFTDRTVSLLFVDTNHRLDHTRHELAAWFPKMHPDGVITGHDYYLHEDPRWADKSGVKEAVDAFVKEHPQYRLQVLLHDYGFFILWPRSFIDGRS